MLKAMVAGQPAESQNDMYCPQYEYYPDYYCHHQPEICPGHPHLCALQDYGPVTVPMVSTNSTPPIAMPVQVPPGHVVQQIVDEHGTLRHVILSPQPTMVPMPPHYGPATNGNQGPQPFYAPQAMGPGYAPPHFGHATPLQPGGMGHVPSPPTSQGHSPPPLNFKDERTQRQYVKLKKKFEQKHMRIDGLTANSPPFSPRKDLVNGTRRSKDRGTSSTGTSEDGEESSSAQEEELDVQLILEILSAVNPPSVTDVDSRCALLHWLPPSLEGRSEEPMVLNSDFRYEVLLSDKGKDGKYKSIYNGVALSCKIQDLRPGTEYSVCLQVYLEELQGSASEPTVFSTPPCEPDQPLPPKVIQRTRSSLQLRWNAPVDNGSHITQYVLECDDGRGTGFVEIYRAKGKQHNMTKLSASTTYKFRLAAINQFGTSHFSDIVTTSTSGSPPGQPFPPILKEASIKALHLAWQKRPLDEDFTLQMDDQVSGHGFLAIYNGRDAHYVCQGLRRHSEYKFRLRAQNEEGVSRWSDEVCYRTLPDRPGAPPRPSVKGRIHAHNFRVKWDPPTDRGGAEITTYIVEINRGNGFEAIYSGMEMECICDRLTPGTTYQVRVSCVSAGGRGYCSEPCTVTTEAVCPGRCSPPRVHGKPRATSLTLKWSYPEYDGGAPLTEFQVEMTCCDSNSRRLVYQGKESECLVTDLSPGQTYIFQVRAFNRVGGGPLSEALEVVSGAAPPGMPSEPSVTCKSPHNVLVQWEDPANNGAPITDYRLEMSTLASDKDFSTVFQGFGHSCEVKGLSAATAYFFRIQANNSAGWGPLSPITHVLMPPSPPSAVSTPRFSPTATSLHISWHPPACHGSEITHYNVDYGENILSTDGPVLEYTLENLQPDTTYRVRVQAVNAVGTGPFSPVLKAATARPPPSPPKLEVVGAGHNYVKLKWGDGKNNNFTQYIVEMEHPRTKEFQIVYHGTNHSCKVSRLNEKTNYMFRAAALNDAGQSDYSDLKECSTSITAPTSLRAPKVTDIQQRCCTVEWNISKPVGGDPVAYQLQLAKAQNQDYRVVYQGDDTKTQITDLEPGTEYLVRVCPIRCSDSGELSGAYSPPTPFTTSIPEPTTNSSRKTSSAQAAEKKPLTDQQWAFIILLSFTFVALSIAFIVQHIIHVNNSSQ